MDLYGPEGYLAIEKLKQNPFMFLIGSRRTGKTYGVSKYLLQNQRKFMYIRRTTGELDFSMSERTFAFRDMEKEGFFLEAKKNGQYSYVLQTVGDDPEMIGAATSLTLVSKMRGFDGSWVTDIMYDEFIPEKHVARIPHEGDAVLNMYETINSNRELEGKPPVRLWMLANANNLNSDVIGAFGIRQKVERMISRGQEYSEYRNITIVLASFSPISARKRETALYQAIDDNEYSEMALNNAFSYDDFSNIAHFQLSEYKPRCRIGPYVVMDHKSEGRTYIIRNTRIPCSRVYDMTDYSMQAFRIGNTDLLNSYIWGLLFFDSFETKVAIAKALPYIK